MKKLKLIASYVRLITFCYKWTFYKLSVCFLTRWFLYFFDYYLVHEINLSFDCSRGIDVIGVFLDISKALNKLWHQELYFKLKSYRVKGKLPHLMTNYLHGRIQRVVLNGQCSSLELIQSGVPQGSVLNQQWLIKTFPGINWALAFNV